MKAKYLLLPTAAILAAGGLWFARTAWRAHADQETTTTLGPGSKTPRGSNFDPNSAASLPSASQEGPALDLDNQHQSGQMSDSPVDLAPPNPTRRFTDFTPEQRVQFARQGHGPGG